MLQGPLAVPVRSKPLLHLRDADLKTIVRRGQTYQGGPWRKNTYSRVVAVDNNAGHLQAREGDLTGVAAVPIGRASPRARGGKAQLVMKVQLGYAKLY